MRRAKAFLRRIHWPAILAAIPTVAGILSDPEALGLLPAKYAHVLAGLGVILQLLVRHVLDKPVPADA